LLFAYLASQLISIINAKNFSLFFKSYHNILIGIIIFLLALFYSKYVFKKGVIYLYLTVTVLTLLFLEISFFLFPSLFLSLTKKFIQWELFSAYLVNFERKRFTLDFNLEMFVPVYLSMFYLQSRIKKHIKNKLVFIVILALVFMTFVSNFRSRAVALIFSLILFFAVLLRRQIKKTALLLAVIFIFSILAFATSRSLFGFNTLDRFLLRKYEDIQPVKNRIKSINHAVELFRLFPLTGVGLGNYIVYNNSAPICSYFMMKNYQKTYFNLVAYSPHNIFFQILSETGILGAVSFTSLLGYFILKDKHYLKENKINLITGLIIASWTIIVYCLFNPSYSLFVFGWFWFLRGLIEGVYENIASA